MACACPAPVSVVRVEGAVRVGLDHGQRAGRRCAGTVGARPAGSRAALYLCLALVPVRQRRALLQQTHVRL